MLTSLRPTCILIRTSIHHPSLLPEASETIDTSDNNCGDEKCTAWDLVLARLATHMNLSYCKAGLPLLFQDCKHHDRDCV